MGTKTINIFLTGGGWKGSFAGGFLYKLGQWFEQNPGYKVGRVYGSSIGTVNGSIFLDDYKKLYDFWNEIKSFKSIVDYWCKIPFIGPIISIIYGFFFKFCLINPKKFYDLIRKYCSRKNNKLTICTTNLSNAAIEYIDCSNDVDHIDHIIGSCSLWLFSRPINIRDKYYMDGGLIKYLPLNKEIISQYANDINVVISCAKNIKRPNNFILGQNLLFYLDNLIHLICDMLYENDINEIIKLNNFRCYYLDQSLIQNISIQNFKEDDVKKLWNNGIYECTKFIETLYINQ